MHFLAAKFIEFKVSRIIGFLFFLLILADVIYAGDASQYDAAPQLSTRLNESEALVPYIVATFATTEMDPAGYSGVFEWAADGNLANGLLFESVKFSSMAPEDSTDVIFVTDGTSKSQVQVTDRGITEAILNSGTLTIGLYDDSQVGALDGGTGFYAVSGTALKNIEVTGTGGTISFKVFNDGDEVRDLTFTHTGSNSLARINNLSGRKEVISTSTTGDEFTTTEEIWDVAPSPDKLLKKTTTVTKAFPWGTEKVTEIDDPDGEARTTSYTYQEDDEANGYGKLETITYPDGNWVKYSFDSSGRVVGKYSPWKSSPATPDLASGTNCKLVATAYSGTPSRISTEISTILGIETNRETYVYTSGTDSSTGEPLRITQQTSKPAGGPQTTLKKRVFLNSQEIHSIDYEDGRRDTYGYEKGDYEDSVFTPDVDGEFERITVTHGTTANPEGVVGRLAREIRIENRDGETVYEQTQFYSEEEEYETVEVVEYEYDEDGHLEETTKNGRDIYSASYFASGKVDTETDDQGIEMSYTYEGDNIKTSTKKGVAAATINSVSYPAQADIVTTYEYDLLGRPVSEIVSSGIQSLPARTTTYTVVGDIASQTEVGLTTTYSYEYGGRKTTVTLPTGATEITENYLDGQTKSVTGTGIVHQFFDYGVHPAESPETDGYADGSLWTTMRLADDESPRWEKTTTDGSGRHRRTEKPTFDGSGTYTFSSTYNTKGQLTKEQRTGLADTIYAYNGFGQLERRGIDMNGSGTLTLASMDRIFDTDSYYWKDGDNVFFEEDGLEFYVDNVGNGVGDYTVHTVNDPDYSEKIERYEQNGTSYASKTEINRTEKLVTKTYDVSDSDIDVVQVVRNGLLQHENSRYVENPSIFSYDVFGREVVKTAQLGWGYPIITTYSSTTGRLTSVKSGTTGPSVVYEYYPAGSGANTGKLKSVKQNGYSTYYSWTLRGELYRQWGSIYPAEFVYDNYGQLVTMRTYRGGSLWENSNWPAPRGTADTTTWIYNENTGLLAGKRDNEEEGADYTWNDANQLFTITLARGVTTTYGYNVAGEVTSKAYSDATPAVSVTYNRRGLPTSVTDGSGVRTRTFTIDRQLDLETYVSGVLPAGYVLDRGYGDSATSGKLTSLSVISSGTVYSGTFEYDARGLPNDFGAASVVGQANLTFTDLPNSTYHSSLHFNISGTSSQEFVVEQNADESLLTYSTWTDSFSPGDGYIEGADRLLDQHQQISLLNFQDETRWEFIYNMRGELHAATRYLDDDPLAASEYNQWLYDNQGNREEYSTALLDWTDYTINALNQYTKIETSTSSEEDFVHDDDGNRTQDASWDYTWDAENRLVSMQTSAAAVTGGATPKKLVFVYDSENRRVSKTVLTLSGTAFTNVVSHKAFVYDGWRPILEVNYSGTTPSPGKTYHWGLDVAGWQNGKSVEEAGGIGGLWMMQSGSTAYFPMYDPMGNVIALAQTGSNKKAATYRYSPFGEQIVSSGTAASVNPLQFQTQYFDEETGLYYWKNRYYDPKVGRWINRDPIEEEGGVNLYNYVRNDPVNKIDPLGLALYWNGTIVYPNTGKAGIFFSATVSYEVTRILGQIGITGRFGLQQVSDPETMPMTLWGLPLGTRRFPMKIFPSPWPNELEQSLEFLVKRFSIGSPILLADVVSVGGGGYTTKYGLGVQYHPDPKLIARLIVHELFHFKTGFLHGSIPGWDDGNYLTAQASSISGYGVSNKEVISCAVADWIVKNGGTPNPRWVAPGWSPKLP